MASTLPRLPLFEAIKTHDAHTTAVVHSLSGRRFTYGELLNDVAAAKHRLQAQAPAPSHSVEGARIAFLVENGYDYVGARVSSRAPRVLADPSSDTPRHPRRPCRRRSAIAHVPRP
jgi:malonyl-CoA/methylmalonyl-CoA synthetase